MKTPTTARAKCYFNNYTAPLVGIMDGCWIFSHRGQRLCFCFQQKFCTAAAAASGPTGEIVKICHRARLLVRRNKTTNARKTNTAATAINYNSMESTRRLDLGEIELRDEREREWKQRTRAAKAAHSTLLLIIHQTVLYYYIRINYCRS
jgi:hypothetical protein